MNRRDFIGKGFSGMAAMSGVAVSVEEALAGVDRAVRLKPGERRSAGAGDSAERLFPTDLPEREWKEFQAAGFSKPVSGVIFHTGKPPCCGVPLGGISTGCIDIEATGVLGFDCLFDACPRKPQLLKPFLGMAVGDKVWVLASENMRAGGMFISCHEAAASWDQWTVFIPEIKGVESAKEIHYWGHFPVADMEYETTAPIGVALRAWAPFLPGDTTASNTPGAVFEVHLRNLTSSDQQGALVFSFPGPTQQEAQVPAKVHDRDMEIGTRSASRPFVAGGVEGKHERIQEPVNGVSVVVETGVGYCLGVIGEKAVVRVGGGLGPDDWMKVRSALPAEQPKDFSATVAVDFELKPKEAKVVRFVLAWFAPQWHGEGATKYTQMFTTRYKNALEVAQFLARDHASLLQRVLGWQEAIYGAEKLPLWLRDTLINVLATIPEDSYWAVPYYPVDWATSGGLFGLMESPRGCPQIECIPCSWYGNIPIVYFFPDLALSSLRGYVHYMREDGAAPFKWGLTGDMANVTWESQKSLNGVCFVDLVSRLWLRTGDDAILREFYPAVKKSTTCTMNLRPGPEGIVGMPKGNVGREWWESEDWYGIVPHIGSMHLSNLKIAERMAEKMGDGDFARQCSQWYQEGSALMEDKAWAGEYYLLYTEPETGRKSDTLMANQIDGDWANRFHGLPNILRSDRFPKVLETIRRTCLNEQCGAVSFAYRDGTPQLRSYGIFPPEIMILGMMFLYAGQRETGMEIVRRLMYDLVCRHGYAFDLPNMLLCDTGERSFGTDYYQNMMFWAMPAAVAGQDLRGPCAPGGLVDRVLQAARGKA